LAWYSLQTRALAVLYPDHNPIIDIIQAIWHAWTEEVKDTQGFREFLKIPKPEPQDEESINSHRTSSHRIPSGLQPMLPGKAQQETP
jgi:hypothetical protein